MTRRNLARHGCPEAPTAGRRSISSWRPGLYVVAPDARRVDVQRQMARPAFRHAQQFPFRFLPYGELARNREAMGRFGQGLKAVEAVATPLP